MIIAIIGTREIKDTDHFKILDKILRYLTTNELLSSVDIVRSGNAEGVDQIANYFSVKGIRVIHYIINESHNYNLRSKTSEYVVGRGSYDNLMYELFPWIKNSNEFVQGLISRNMSIIMGKEGEPRTDLVFWYTGKGVVGGTAYGVKLARHLGIKDVEIVL